MAPASRRSRGEILALPWDGRLLFLTRFIRLFSYGSLSVILVFYLTGLGLTEAQTGTLLTLILLGAFSAIALILAGIGIYGVISYSVAQRTKEIGIRVALGAGRQDVIEMVLLQGARMASAGLIIAILSPKIAAGDRARSTMSPADASASGPRADGGADAATKASPAGQRRRFQRGTTRRTPERRRRPIRRQACRGRTRAGAATAQGGMGAGREAQVPQDALCNLGSSIARVLAPVG